MMCADGENVDWPYSDAPMTTLSSARIKALASEDLLVKCRAHAAESMSTLRRPYDKTGASKALHWRWIGQRIRDYRVEPFVRDGYGDRRLQIALRGRKVTRRQILRQLISTW